MCGRRPWEPVPYVLEKRQRGLSLQGLDDAIGSFAEGAALVTGRQGRHGLLSQRRGPVSRPRAGTHGDSLPQAR